MAFTNWLALKTAILNAISDGSVLTSSYTINGRTINFRSLKEVTDFIVFIDKQITAEAGGARTFASFKNPT